jgi:hypothetical protein
MLRRILASAAPRAVSRTEILAFLSGYWIKSLFADPRKAWRAQGLRIEDHADVIGAIDDATSPRLPDAFEHPRSDIMVRRRGVMLSRRHASALQSAGLDTIDGAFTYADGQKLDKPGLSRHRQRFRAKLAGNAESPRVVYIKRFFCPPLSEQLRRMREFRLAAGTAQREAYYGERLAQLGVPTIRCIAAGQRMTGIWERMSYCILEEVPGESLERLAARAAADTSGQPTWPERKEIIRQLSCIAARLHADGLFHRDFYLSHLFFSRNADGGIVVSVIDLARMISRAPSARRWVVKDLAALDYSAPAPLVTRADRMRFLYDYHRIVYRTVHRGSIRALAAGVRRRARRMALHDARRAKTERATTT